ncbi:MAG: serine hydrolase [Bacteroidales bacterium]|nr:serine hydrolase [Bacteroidales bacterium]
MKSMRLFLIGALAWLSIAAFAQSQPLQRSTPAAEGVEAKAVTLFFDSLMSIPQTEMHHVMVLRHGKVIGELHPKPFHANDPHTLYSESKTFTAIAVGLCVDDKLLKVTDRVVSFFPDKLPEKISDNLAKMTLRDLLTMETGIKPDWNFRSNTKDWVRKYLSLPVSDAPGTKYQYDSMCTFLLSAIVQRVTGKTMMQLLNQRVFGPMGIKDAEWEQSPDGINTGGWGLRLSAESQAKVGQLLLQKGMWNGKQLVSKKWVEEASSRQVQPYEKGTAAHTKSPGYGYQIWMAERPGSFRADGALGQYVVVIPDKDMVVLINGVSFQTPFELKYIWTVLLPGVKNTSVAADDAQHKNLQEFCAKAALPAPQGKSVDKKWCGKTIEIGGSKKILTLAFDQNGMLQYHYDGRKVKSASGKWQYEASVQTPPYSIHPVDCFKGLKQEFTTASSYAWKGETLTIQTYWTDFISGETITVRFVSGGKVLLTVQRNYDKKPTTLDLLLLHNLK